MAFRRLKKSRAVVRRRRPNMKRRIVSRKGKQFRKHRAVRHIKVKSYGISTSFDKVFLKPNKFGSAMRKKYWLGAKNIFQSNYTSNVATGGTSNSNQNCTTVTWFSPSDMNAALQAYSLGQSATGNTNNTNRIFWNKVIGEVVMTNSSNSNMEVDIYTFSTKRDTVNNIQGLWQKGIFDQTAQIVTDYTASAYGLTPLDSVAVTSQYKCFKITHISLSPGQSHRHSFCQHLCRPIDNEIMYNAISGSGDSAMAGITMQELFVVRGFPDSTTDAANVGIAPVKLNMFIDKKYEFKYLFDIDYTTKFSLPTLGVVGNTIYNQGSGVSATAAII